MYIISTDYPDNELIQTRKTLHPYTYLLLLTYLSTYMVLFFYPNSKIKFILIGCINHLRRSGNLEIGQLDKRKVDKDLPKE